MKYTLLHAIQERDIALIERFCDKGTIRSSDGNIIKGVCKPIEMHELLTLLHTYDALLLEELEK